MVTSSLLDTEFSSSVHRTGGIDSFGPSDASDTGSDSIGVFSSNEMDSDSDRYGTGERGSIESVDPDVSRDILPDHIEQIDSQAALDNTAQVSSDAEQRNFDFVADMADVGEEDDLQDIAED